MGGCRCSYKNCHNTTKTTDSIHFFHYPVKHKERCRKWINNANKPHFIDLEEEQLKNKVVCETHFEDCWFPNSQRKRLLQGAVPTLDGDAVDELPRPEHKDPPHYLSNQLQDVQVLPANDDGTIFVLDTDSMFNRSQQVESYIYKNGAIVPANKQKGTSAVKRSASTSYSILNNSFETSNPTKAYQDEHSSNIMEEEFEAKTKIKKEMLEYNEGVTDKYSTYQELPLGLERNSEQTTHKKVDQEDMYEKSDKKFTRRKVGSSKNQSKSTPDKSIKKNYLQKLKQHSRDIASIKKMLKEKALTESKPDITAALNSIKQVLPPSFFTILNLNLDNNCDLTDDDIDFFTTIHKTSPEVYQLLIDKYRWNLPCVNIVEAPME